MNNLNKFIRFTLVLLFTASIFGCASTVNRSTGTVKETSSVKEEVVQVIKFSPLKSLTVTLDENAQKSLLITRTLAVIIYLAKLTQS